jgi:ketosteroid isomerase-like protein
MSQQDIETVRDGYDAFNRKDLSAVLALYDPQIEWIEAGGGRAPAGTFRGPQSVASEVFAKVPQNFDDFRADPEQFIDAGEHVVVVGRFRGKARSGATLDAPFVHVYRMRNGKSVHFQNYVDAASWANAWGS